MFLAPGAEGFDHGDRLTLNPSYYNFPAIRALAAASGDERWPRIEADGLWLLEGARFGHYGLPADWVDVMTANAEIRPALGRQLMFSWDALRVPLYLAWAGEHAAPALTAAVRFWNVRSGAAVPAWNDLRTGANAPYAASAGVIAIAQLSTAAVAGEGAAGQLPQQSHAHDYYAAALSLLVRVAWQESSSIAHSATAMAES